MGCAGRCGSRRPWRHLRVDVMLRDVACDAGRGDLRALSHTLVILFYVSGASLLHAARQHEDKRERGTEMEHKGAASRGCCAERGRRHTQGLPGPLLRLLPAAQHGKQELCGGPAGMGRMVSGSRMSYI